MPNSPTPSIIALLGSRALFGAERANIDLLRLMQASGARVTCLVRDEDWPENHQLRHFLDDQGLEWRTCPFASYPNLRHAKYWPQVIRENYRAIVIGNKKLLQLCEEVGATHIHGFNPFLTFSFFRAINKISIPLIYRCGDYPTSHNAFWRFIWEWLGKRTSHFGTESRFVEELLLQRGIPTGKISVIPAPPPLRRIRSDVALISCTKSNGPSFAYVGQVAAHKGVGELVAAFRIVRRSEPKARLFIAGPMSEQWARDLRDQILGQPDGKNIMFLGHVEDVPGLLSVCDVHVAPTIKPEPYGLVAVEAKLASRPSIVFSGGGLGELVEHEVDGIVVQDRTAEALADAMLAYCRDLKNARAHGLAAFASLTKRLGTNRYAGRWREIYDVTMPNA